MMGTYSDVVMAAMAIINTAILLLSYWRVSQIKTQTNSMHHEIVNLTRSDARKNGIIETLKDDAKKQ